MYAREQLKRCFQCKHNIKCWQLDNDFELGASEKEQTWPMKKIIEHIKNAHKINGAECAADYMGMMITTWIATLNRETMTAGTEYKRNATFNPLFVICAMANTSNDGWECPDEFIFEVR